MIDSQAALQEAACSACRLLQLFSNKVNTWHFTAFRLTLYLWYK